MALEELPQIALVYFLQASLLGGWTTMNILSFTASIIAFFTSLLYNAVLLVTGRDQKKGGRNYAETKVGGRV